MESLDIVGTAQLGARLATALDLMNEAMKSTLNLDLPKLVAVVNTTSSTLQSLSQQDTTLFTWACINDINALSATCRVIYEGILVLMTQRAKALEEENHEIGQMTQEKIEHLFSCLKNKIPLTYNAREWLGPRLDLCKQELKHVKFELVLHLLLGNIAEFQSRASGRSPGDYDKENAMRVSAYNVATRRLSYHKNFTKKREEWIKATEPSPPVESPPEEVKSSASSVTAVAPTPVTEATPSIAESSVSEEDDGYSTCSSVSVHPDPSYGQRIRRFLSAVFRRRVRCDEWDGEDIEAYIVNMSDTDKLLTKLELEETAILSSLRKLTTRSLFNRPPVLVEQLASLDLPVRTEFDNVVLSMKRQSLHEMTLIAMGATKTTAPDRKRSWIPYNSGPSLTLYFKVGDKLKPIHLVDPQETKFTLPYNSCLTYGMLSGCLPNITRSIIYHPAIMNGNYKLFADKTVVTIDNWNSLRRPGMTLRLQVCPPPLPIPVPPYVRNYPRNPNPIRGPRPEAVRKGEIYQEVNKLFKLSRSWTPDAESLKGSGIGHLLRLWTNAIDPDNGDDSDGSSVSSGSSSIAY
ncbi:uncharacterized protein B0J16DRAFT_345789 [Fusarium flagelliforme]|nr:uncharacterized protein B0J16DRAFT_345789 [Fusarium flagelliforme]KAH7183426.1 hypothetical protein B0J16DRAFT_345789 [Fusarium flagelliforme]